MAMVTCPKCKKIVNNASKKCPNCGASLIPLSSGTENKMRTIGSVLMVVSCVLLALDLFNVVKTYVGSPLLGISFFIQGLAMSKLKKETDEKNKANVFIAAGVIFFLVGLVFLYMDLNGIFTK